VARRCRRHAESKSGRNSKLFFTFEKWVGIVLFRDRKTLRQHQGGGLNCPRIVGMAASNPDRREWWGLL